MPAKKKAPNKTAASGRRGNGQFGPGNDYGTKSGPYSKQKKEWRDQVEATIRKVVPISRLEKQFEAVAKRADRGDREALRFILDYSYGKPPQQVNLGNEDGKPLKIISEVNIISE